MQSTQLKTFSKTGRDEEFEAQTIALKTLYNSSLYHTSKYLLGYKDITANTHGPMILSLTDQKKRKLICVPRGTFKSSVASIGYPIWLLNNNPNLRILLDSELYTNSKNFLREIRTHMLSDNLTDIYGSYDSSTWNESEIIVRNRTKILKDPSIAAGGIGTTKVGAHFDVIIGDDYNGPENSSTPEQRRKVIDHYQYNQSILDPGGIYVIIGTRYHEDDLIGWIIKNELGYKNFDDFERWINGR